MFSIVFIYFFRHSVAKQQFHLFCCSLLLNFIHSFIFRHGWFRFIVLICSVMVVVSSSWSVPPLFFTLIQFCSRVPSQTQLVKSRGDDEMMMVELKVDFKEKKSVKWKKKKLSETRGSRFSFSPQRLIVDPWP